MAYVVTGSCVKCKDAPCAKICPQQCFCCANKMLVINPDICLGCGVCSFECPFNAIIDESEDESGEWTEFNKKLSKESPKFKVDQT